MLTNKAIIKIIIVLLLLACLLFYLFYKVKEPFNKNISNKQIIFLGDSILNNSNYVDNSETVLYQFQQLVNTNIIMKAEDGAKLYNFSKQYNFLLNDNKYNNSNTYIIISIGGNDILGLTNKVSSNNNSEFNELIKKYNEEISFLHSKIPKANILLVGLYYPIDTRFSIYKDFITKWNSNMVGLGYPVIHLDTLITDKADIVSSIEPSPLGSKKIAKAIYNKIGF